VRILFVDDDPSATRLYGTLLTSAGHEVVAVDSGVEAVERAAREPFDLVITDLHMPGLKGDVTLSLCACAARAAGGGADQSSPARPPRGKRVTAARRATCASPVRRALGAHAGAAGQEAAPAGQLNEKLSACRVR